MLIVPTTAMPLIEKFTELWQSCMEVKEVEEAKMEEVNKGGK